MDKMREEFEAWALSQKWCVDCVDMAGGVYINTYVGCAWQAWQASRKALVVELPIAFPVCDDKDSAEVYFADDIHKALDAAGVSYK